MATMELKKEGAIYILTLTNGERGNGFTDDTLAEYNVAFDEIEASQENGALVITSDDPKAWCTGIDLDWIKTQADGYISPFGEKLDQLFLRLALLPTPTIGCLTGHTFAGGAMLSMCLDFRLMRADKGWFCLPEVDIRIPFTPIMYQILKMWPAPPVLKELMFTGRKIGGGEAAQLQVVDRACEPDTLLNQCMELAQILAQKDRATYAHIKHGIREQLLALR